MTLTDFLLERIAEDEAAAKDCTIGPWWWLPEDMSHADRILQLGSAETRDDGGACVACFYGMDHIKSHPPKQADAEHIERWNPARVLAECEAKRRIVFEAYHSLRAGAQRGERTNSYEMILKFLGMPYADHPDYREEWRV